MINPSHSTRAETTSTQQQALKNNINKNEILITNAHDDHMGVKSLSSPFAHQVHTIQSNFHFLTLFNQTFTLSPYSNKFSLC